MREIYTHVTNTFFDLIICTEALPSKEQPG
jgi:hypothetical protein